MWTRPKEKCFAPPIVHTREPLQSASAAQLCPVPQGEHEPPQSTDVSVPDITPSSHAPSDGLVVGSKDGDELGDELGAREGAAEGSAVGAELGAAVLGMSVGAALGATVGAAVGSQVSRMA